MVDDFSGGKIGEMSDRIRYIINSLKHYEAEGKAVLEQEMKRIEDGFDDAGLSELINN